MVSNRHISKISFQTLHTGNRDWETLRLSYASLSFKRGTGKNHSHFLVSTCGTALNWRFSKRHLYILVTVGLKAWSRVARCSWTGLVSHGFFVCHRVLQRNVTLKGGYGVWFVLDWYDCVLPLLTWSLCISFNFTLALQLKHDQKVWKIKMFSEAISSLFD